jgi:hypothetical protein
MDQELQNKRPRRRLAITLFIVAGLFLSACRFLEAAPERSFTTQELLISLSDMPPGWQVIDPPQKIKDHLSDWDASGILFQAETDFPRRVASQRAYRYRNAWSAEGIYEDYVLSGQIGSTPPEWTYRSPLADQSDFACYDYERREPLHCRWSSLYEEYVVIFGSWLIPDRMSLDDMEQAVRAIDARMAQYLDTP